MRLATDGTEQPSESGGLESPSLFADVEHGPTAFELKFLLSEERARGVELRAAQHLSLDHHADPSRGNAYPILSLYTDTPDFDVYRRTPAAGGCKYRVRRYGDQGPIFVEQKIKNGDRVRKRRAPADSATLAAIARNDPQPDWSGDWFLSGLAEQRLSPICRIAYDRVAYLGTMDGGTVRITFDRNVRGTAETNWELGHVDGPPLLDGEVICEFKFRLALPSLFKAIVEEFGLVPSAVSKYRRFMQTKFAPASGSDADD
jgi:hypothetical protein